MKKFIMIALLVILALVLLLGAMLWYFMGKPLYQPGMVRQGQNLSASLTPPEQSGEEQFWTVEPGIELFHFADGTGRPILFIHGGPGYPPAEPFPGLVTLTSAHTMVYYQQRGCGKSTRPITSFSSSNYYENMKTLDRALGIGAQVADIERIRQLLKEDRLIIIGHSFGAFLAALYAAEFPERVEKLILVAPADIFVMPAEGGGLFEEIKNQLSGDLRQEYEIFLKEYLDFQNIFQKTEAEMAEMNRKIATYYIAAAKTRNPGQREDIDLSDNGGWMVQAMYFSMGLKHDYTPALKKVTAPVLVLHGENDLQPEKNSRKVAGYFPNAQVSLINNAGHFIFIDQPEAFAESIQDFLEK